MNKKKKTIIILALLLVVFIGSISYALWSVTLEQTDSNIVKTGCFTVDMVEETDEINLPEEYPVLDSEGKTYTPFTFTIQNTCTIDSSYSVNLDVDGATTLGHEYVKVALNNDAIRVLTNYEKATNEDKYQLTTGTLAGASSEGAGDGESVTYNLRLWLDANTPESQMSKDFIAKVVIENITTTINKQLLATVDYSRNGNVVANYYNDGSIVFVGTGDMAFYDDDSLLDLLFNELITNDKTVNGIVTNISDLSEYSQGIVGACAQLSFGNYRRATELSGGLIDLTYVTNNEELYVKLEKFVEDTELIPEEEKEEVLGYIKTITEYIPQITTIKIEEGITDIGQSVFSDIAAINPLILPSTIIAVKAYSFLNSDIQVILNNGLEKIGQEAFRDSMLSSVYLPSSLKRIGESAFSNSLITEIIIPESTTVEVNAFKDALELTNVVWNSNNNYISVRMFENCPKLKSVIISQSVTKIENNAFDNKSVNPNLVLKFRISEEKKNIIMGSYSLFDFTNYNVIWEYTE